MERLAERGRRTEQGAARAGSSRYVREKGLSPRSGGLVESNGPGTQKVAGMQKEAQMGGWTELTEM